MTSTTQLALNIASRRKCQQFLKESSYFFGAKTLSIMTLSIMTLSITTLGIMTFSIMTISIMTLGIMTFLIINNK